MQEEDLEDHCRPFLIHNSAILKDTNIWPNSPIIQKWTKHKYGNSIRNFEPASKNSIKKFYIIWRKRHSAISVAKKKSSLLKTKKALWFYFKTKKKPTRLELKLIPTNWVVINKESSIYVLKPIYLTNSTSNLNIWDLGSSKSENKTVIWKEMHNSKAET